MNVLSGPRTLPAASRGSEEHARPARGELRYGPLVIVAEDAPARFRAQRAVLHLFQKMLPNTCGFGRYRGGCGAAVGYLTHHSSHVVRTSSQKEAKIPSHAGLFGGYAQTVVPGVRVTGTDTVRVLASGRPDIPMDDIALVRSNVFGGELILEHQTRPAIISRRGELFCSSTQDGGGTAT